jgi:hypothetical protein
MPLLLVVFGALACVEQDLSLVERARLNGGKTAVIVDVDAPLGTLESISRGAELILLGNITSSVVRLSTDQQRVLTEYAVVPMRVFKGALPAQTLPGPAPPLRVQRGGGTLQIDEVEITYTVNIFPESECVRTGETVFVFLSPDQREPGTYLFYNGEYGAFRVVGDQVVAMTKAAARNRKDRPITLDAFIAAVARHLR